MAHDFDAQRKDTFATFAELSSDHGLPDEADIDYFLVPGSDNADWRPLADALSNAGYACEWIEAAAPDEAAYLVATLAETAVTAMSIWIGEEVATKEGLAHGFTPDGWGLYGA